MNKKQKYTSRYFENRYSFRDYQAIRENFENRQPESSFKKELEQHWLEFNEQELPEKDMEPMLQRLNQRVWLNDNKNKKSSRYLTILQRIAAILFLPVLIAGLTYFFLEQKSSDKKVAWAEIQCPQGVRTHFELPDGSTGYLNSGSVLRYPVPFTSERQVKLSGEAFFDVTHDKSSPFHVLTDNLDVKVLGTRFNVLAFDDMNYEEVTLEKGKVEVYNRNQKLISSLVPDHQLNYNLTTGKYIQKSIAASQYVSWIEGKLIFRDEKFDQVAKRLSRWYNAEIIIADSRLNDYVFHATFVNEQLEEALKLIELTTPITYQLQKREKLNDGSYAMKKVILNFSEEKLKEFK